MMTQAQTKEKSKTQEVAIVEHQGTSLRVTWQDVKNLICPLASDQETAVFLKTCQALQLSPFHNEIYLIKYNERDKAATVVAIGAYLKAAEINENYDGHAAGIILRDSGGKLEFREGAFLLDDEMDKLVGGWARVYRKDRDRETYMAINKAECIRYTREGKPTRFWTREKQASMLRKTALKRSLVEAFPSLFAGTLSNAEVAPEPEAEYQEIPEGELPPAFEKNGEKNWRKFWPKVKSELGLTREQAHQLLHVDSIKKDLIDQGVSMEKIWDSLVHALQGQKEAARVEQVIDALTGEILPPEEEAGSATEVDADEAWTEIERETDEARAKDKKTKRDPTTIKDVNMLLQACHDDWGMQPKQVYAELNVSGPMEIADPAEMYERIAAVRG